MLGTIQLLLALALVGYTGFVVLRARRRSQPVKVKAFAALGAVAVVAVFVLPALLKAAVVALFSTLVGLVVLGVGGFVAAKMLQRRKGRAELT